MQLYNILSVGDIIQWTIIINCSIIDPADDNFYPLSKVTVTIIDNNEDKLISKLKYP